MTFGGKMCLMKWKVTIGKVIYNKLALLYHFMTCHDDERLQIQMEIQIQIQIGSSLRFHDGDDDD